MLSTTTKRVCLVGLVVVVVACLVTVDAKKLTKRDTHASSAQHAQHAHHHHQWAAAGDADAAADAHEGADGTQSAAANGEYESIKPKLKKPKTLKTPSVYDQCKQECKRQRDEESVNQYVERLRAELQRAEEEVAQRSEQQLAAPAHDDTHVIDNEHLHLDDQHNV